MNILEITGEPIGTGGQEMFIINVLRHINMKDLKIDLLTPYYCENEIYREEVVNKGGQVFTCPPLFIDPEGLVEGVADAEHRRPGRYRAGVFRPLGCGECVIGAVPCQD